MKNVFLSAILWIGLPLAIQAQFKMGADGIASFSNVKLDGMLGSGNYNGVLTVEAYDRHGTTGESNEGVMLSIKQNYGAHPIVVRDMFNSNRITFKVDYNGFLYGSGYATLSDSTQKTDIVPLQPTLAKLKQLHGISFKYKNPMEKTGSTFESDRKRIGLLAQDVEKVFPEAVCTQDDGNKSIIYGDLVAVLISAFNEMQDSMEVKTTQIEELRRQINELKSVSFTHPEQVLMPQVPEKRTERDIGTNDAMLEQNSPNPFSRTTFISYQLPADVMTASICIYNLNGTQLKQYPLDETMRQGKITVGASTFSPGIYIYALIIDGQMEASKRMIITE